MDAVERRAWGPIIRAERERRGWSQEQLEAESGITRRTIGKIESGLGVPQEAKVRAVLEALGIETSRRQIDADVEQCIAVLTPLLERLNFARRDRAMARVLEVLGAELRDQARAESRGSVPLFGEGSYLEDDLALASDDPEDAPALAAADLLIRRYLKQANDDPAEALTLLVHDGAKGSNSDEDTWNAALERLQEMVPEPIAEDLPADVAARRSKKHPPRGPKGEEE